VSQNPPTTDRARRQRGVDTGARTDAVDRVPDPPDPRGRGRQSTSRSRQTSTASEIAGDLGIDRSGVGTVDRIEGMDVFLRSSGAEQFGDVVRSDFASSADFVAPDDVEARVDADAISADPFIAPDRRGRVASRARQETAADTEFIEAADLQADVGAMGVTGLGVREDRRDDIAARELEATTALGSVDPDSDLRSTGDGFGLTSDAQRRLGALQIDEQLPDVTVTADDVTLEDGQAVFEREVRR